MKKLFLFAILSILLSCSGEKVDEKVDPSAVSQDSLLSEAEMEAVLYDMYMTEAFIRQMEREGQNVIYISEHYYNLLFEKHHIDTVMLTNSYLYYANKPEVFKEINQNVLDSLIVEETNQGQLQE